MKKIIEFKSRKQTFDEDIKKSLLNNKNLDKAFIIYANKKGDMYSIGFNIELSELKYFRQILDNQIRDLEFDEFLREHLHEYIEF